MYSSASIAVSRRADRGGEGGGVPVRQLREADPGGLQGHGQEPARPGGRRRAGAGLAAVAAR